MSGLRWTMEQMAYKDHDRKLRLFLDICRDQVERRQIQTTDKRNVPNEIVHYYSFQDELTVHDGVVIKGERVVIPDALRSDMIHRVHSAHLGIEEEQGTARYECPDEEMH